MDSARIKAFEDGSRVLSLVGGGLLSFREYGDPGGRPLVFFHGWPGSSGQGVFMHAAALAAGYRVISVDRPGMGRSSRIPGRHFLHIPPLVAELAGELRLEGIDVVGVSGGGPYALACAWAMPHLVNAVAVCCGAPPLDTPEARRRFSMIYRGMLSLNDRCPVMLQALLAPVTLAARIRPPMAFLKVLTLALGPRDRLALNDRTRFAEFFPSFLGAMRSGHRAVFEDGQCYSQPWPFEVSEIRVPVRVWHGTQDTNFHYSLAERLASRIPGAVFRLREEGHYSLPAFCVEEILSDLQSCRVAG